MHRNKVVVVVVFLFSLPLKLQTYYNSPEIDNIIEGISEGYLFIISEILVHLSI